MPKRAGPLQRLGQRLLGVSTDEIELARKIVQTEPSEEKSITTAQTLPFWMDGQPHYTDWTQEKAVRQGYKASGILYACIELISDAASSVPLKAYRRTSKDEEWEPSEDEPIQRLIDSPNEFMSREEMIKRIAQHLLLSGNAIWTKMRFEGGPMKGLPSELWPIAPDGIKPIKDRELFIRAYEWYANGESIEIDVRDVLHFMQINPADPYWGIGSLQALFRTIETDIEAQAFQKVGMQNRGVVGGLLSFKMPLSGDQYDKARKEVNSEFAGSSNARKILVLGSDADYKKLNMTLEEMDFIESRKMTREEITQGMRVPPPMVGIYDQATLANIEISRQIFWLDRMTPFLRGIEGVYNRVLVPEFDDSGLLWVGFDMTGVDALQQNLEEKVSAFERLVASRVTPQAAARIAGIDLNDEDVEPPPDPFAMP